MAACSTTQLSHDDAKEFLREAVRGALIEGGYGLLGARIDQFAELTIDVLLDHPSVVRDALGLTHIGWMIESTIGGGGIEVFYDINNKNARTAAEEGDAKRVFEEAS